MKVRCEYCQNMVDQREPICPFCGSALPEPPPRPRQSGAAPRRRGAAFLTIFLAALLALGWQLIPRGGSAPERSDRSVSSAMAEVSAGEAGGGSYQTVIVYYLESGEADTAYRLALELLHGEAGPEYSGWCVEQFLSFGRRELAARLAAASGTLSGAAELAETPLSELLPDSPLCQAMELVLGRTAGNITLADLQGVTGLSIGALDRLTNSLKVGVAFDEAGEDLIEVTVESDGSFRSPGLICFQGLRRLSLASANVRSAEDFFLPNLREFYLRLPMDGTDLSGFTHLKKLERLQTGGASLTSLDGLEELPALTALTLFDTGLTDLSALAARSQITELALLDNDKLSSVASLSQASHLRKLTLSGKGITDLTPLSSLTGLSSLRVEGTSIRDAAFLEGLSGLEELSLIGNRELGAVPELAGMGNLRRLELESEENFASKEDLAGLSGLLALDLKLGKKLSFLEPLTGLEELTLRVKQSEVDLQPLGQFSHLKRLRVKGESFTRLDHLEALRGLPLVELDLSGLSFYGPIDPVLEIPSLEELDLSGASSEGTDYGKFANLLRLRVLNLDGYRDMIDWPPGEDESYWSYEAGPASAFADQLGLLAGLEELHLAGCGVESVESLSGLKDLQYLDLSGNGILDISPLAGLEALRFLDLSGSRIADLSPVEGREGLTLIR